MGILFELERLSWNTEIEEVDVNMEFEFESLSSESKAVCTICQTPMSPDDVLVQCDSCGQSFHAACWEDNKGCGTYGCDRTPEPCKVTLFNVEAAGAWGDIKTCPQCGQTLKASCLKCKHCKAEFDTRAPMSHEDYVAQQERRKSAKKATASAIVLFCVSALGVLAPLTLVGSAVSLVLRHHKLKHTPGVAELLFLSSLALSVSYTFLMLLIFVGRW